MPAVMGWVSVVTYPHPDFWRRRLPGRFPTAAESRRGGGPIVLGDLSSIERCLEGAARGPPARDLCHGREAVRVDRATKGQGMQED